MRSSGSGAAAGCCASSRQRGGSLRWSGGTCGPCPGRGSSFLQTSGRASLCACAQALWSIGCLGCAWRPCGTGQPESPRKTCRWSLRPPSRSWGLSGLRSDDQHAPTKINTDRWTKNTDIVKHTRLREEQLWPKGRKTGRIQEKCLTNRQTNISRTSHDILSKTSVTEQETSISRFTHTPKFRKLSITLISPFWLIKEKSRVQLNSRLIEVTVKLYQSSKYNPTGLFRRESWQETWTELKLEANVSTAVNLFNGRQNLEVQTLMSEDFGHVLNWLMVHKRKTRGAECVLTRIRDHWP